jgi:hypothetical protein
MRLGSQPARVWPSCHAEGREFESLHPLKTPVNRGFCFLEEQRVASFLPNLGGSEFETGRYGAFIVAPAARLLLARQLRNGSSSA